MADQKRGDDAANHTPKPAAPDHAKSPARKPGEPPQDAANYQDKIDGGLAQPIDKLNSANDE